MKVAQGVLVPVCPKRKCSTLKHDLGVFVHMCVWKGRFPLLTSPDLSGYESFCNNHMPVGSN